MFSLSFEAKAKHNAWLQAKGTSQADARSKYIAYSKEMTTKYGTNWFENIIILNT